MKRWLAAHILTADDLRMEETISLSNKEFTCITEYGVYRSCTLWDRCASVWYITRYLKMMTKKKTQREPFLFQLIFDLFGPDESHEAEVQQMTNREFYAYLVFVTMAMFILSFLVKVFTT